MNDSPENRAPGQAVATLPEEQREQLAANIRAVQARIAAAAEHAGHAAAAVQLVAVTKTLPLATIRAAYELGLTCFGENRVQEARGKLAELQRANLTLPSARWELIGHLQTNKAAPAVATFDRIQSVDSVRLAEALSARVVAAGRTLPILLEVNVAGESSKSGFAPGEVTAAAEAIARLPGLVGQGLMTVAPLADDPETVRPVFRRLRELRDRLREAVPDVSVGATTAGGGWCELSMGMSDDFEVAIAEGATLVRIGRVLFGARPAR
jgi:pyridoxal phosphate enzyme (YggS family)